MEFGSESEIVDAHLLQILGEGVQIAARIGEWRLAELRSDKSATLDANFKTIHVGDGGAKRFVGTIEALQKARMLPVVEASGTKQQVEPAKSADNFYECRLGLRDDGRETYWFRSNFLN